ncbi:MAG: putative PEP-binding protein, partial [Actinomycetota bacterium]
VAVDAGGITVAGTRIGHGEWVSIDGRTGEVFAGHIPVEGLRAPEELPGVLDVADRIRHGAQRPVLVRANADNADDAAHARRLGAEGVGLCRTEHMFLATDRLPLVRRFILTDDARTEAGALAALEEAQQSDFEGILRAMDGLPVTVRLLDPPLHEFLPDLETLAVADARGELDDEGRIELAAVRRLHEVNPMIGTRGVRLGVVRPGLYEMQVRALCRAMHAVSADGVRCTVEVMIPLVVGPAEMRTAHDWVTGALAAVGMPAGSVSVGTMVETPRAALVAGELAAVADFFSFGTNDLTQLTWAFSRDDVGSRLIPAYARGGLIDHDPFDRLDADGVGRLISIACAEGRAANPSLKVGVCGEHAGDPHSVEFLVGCGVDYVS